MKHKIHRRYFISYFADACRYVAAADDSEKEVKTRGDQENRAMYVRSAILHCALALEAAANACLDFLDLQKGAHEDFDKLQTLGKFDVFLSHIAPGKRIDREHNLVRPIRNLISCRNTYVHSKVLTEEVNGQQIVLKTWEPLGLPKNQSHWQPIHAVKVFTVTADFLNYFFFELCPFRYDNPQHRGNVASILGSVVFREDGEELCDGVRAAPLRDEEVWSVSTVERKYDIQCGFTGMYSSNQHGPVLPKRKWGDYSHCDTSTVGIPFRPVVCNVPSGFLILMTGSPPKKKPKDEAAKD